MTLILGGLAALPVGYFLSWPWGAGIFTGAVMAWFNFRWLRRGMDALTEAATAQVSEEIPRIPVFAYFKTLFRYGLIALAVYVIFRYLNVPVLSMIVGLCALGAATTVVAVYEILRPQE